MKFLQRVSLNCLELVRQGHTGRFPDGEVKNMDTDRLRTP
jgi:hypothetical protein